MAKSALQKRTRAWASIVYEESAPENWREKLQSYMVQTFVSPLHDSDLKEDGSAKKPHWHVLMMYDGVKTPEQAREVFESFGGVGCEPVQSVRGYARYLCHLDNPEKHQYNSDDVCAYCGADYVSAIGQQADKYTAIAQMMQWICDNDVIAYSDLLEYAAINRQDWFRVLCDNGTMVIKEYIKSRAWKAGIKPRV